VRGKHCPDYRIRKPDGQVVGYVEVKSRKNYTEEAIRKLGGVFVSEKKYLMLLTLERKGFAAYFVVAFSDLWMVWRIKTATVERDYGGRKDRNDPYDEEVVMRFDHDEAVIFNGGGQDER
jgi:hypothetical protein